VRKIDAERHCSNFRRRSAPASTYRIGWLLPVLALLRHANGRWECLFIGGERKSLVGCQTDAKDPNRKSHSFHPIGDALDEVLAPYRAIVSTISIPTCFVTKQAAQQPNLQGGNFWTLIPRLRGLILGSDSLLMQFEGCLAL
jgi:hypothetical protein